MVFTEAPSENTAQNKVTFEIILILIVLFLGALSRIMSEFHKNPDFQNLPSTKPTTMRALFTVGLLCKHFDFDSKAMGETRVMLKLIINWICANKETNYIGHCKPI